MSIERPNNINVFETALRDQGYELGSKCCGILCLASITSLALFIIGCVGASGSFPGSAIGWTTVGLGGASFALMASLGNFEKRKFELLQLGLLTAAYVTVGALGAAGVLSATQVGWGIIGTTLANMPLSCCVMPVIKHRVTAESV